jgi:hypothetical protein
VGRREVSGQSDGDVRLRDPRLEKKKKKKKNGSLARPNEDPARRDPCATFHFLLPSFSFLSSLFFFFLSFSLVFSFVFFHPVIPSVE